LYNSHELLDKIRELPIAKYPLLMLGDKLATSLITNIIDMIKEYTDISIDEILAQITSTTLTNVLTGLAEDNEWKSLINLRQKRETKGLLQENHDELNSEL